MDRQRGFEIAKGFEDKSINLPQRSTKNSAGYDFEVARQTVVKSLSKAFIENVFKSLTGEQEWDKEVIIKSLKPTLVPTGVKSYMAEDEVLYLYNRSSNPLKKLLILANGVGVIDSDYYNNPDNDGHIMFQFINLLPFNITLKKGDKIGQGVFSKFLKTDTDNANGNRVSGFGSTDATK